MPNGSGEAAEVFEVPAVEKRNDGALFTFWVLKREDGGGGRVPIWADEGGRVVWSAGGTKFGVNDATGAGGMMMFSSMVSSSESIILYKGQK